MSNQSKEQTDFGREGSKIKRELRRRREKRAEEVGGEEQLTVDNIFCFRVAFSGVSFDF